MEESVLYPELKEFAKNKITKALQEHAEIKKLLDKLLDADLNEDSFESQFNKLMEDFRHHVEKEESQDGILELARKNFDDKKLSEMAAAMSDIQQRMRRHDLAA
jgi:hypothetical protein